jgi:general secretion pathway protein G
MPTEIRSAVALLPEAAKADFLVTFNYLRLFQMITAIIPFPMPQMDIPTKSNIVCAGKAGGGRLTVDVALPKEHLTEIMGAFQRMMQQRTTMQPREDTGPVTKTKVNLMLLHNAVIRFKMDTGRYPTKEEGLHALVERPRYVTNYPPGGYLENTDMLKDAWGNDFVYELYSESGKPFVIISYGADGAEGGEGQNADLHSGEN